VRPLAAARQTRTRHAGAAGRARGDWQVDLDLHRRGHDHPGMLPGKFYGAPKSVLVATTEDSWAQTIVPRLIAAGADLTRVIHERGANSREGRENNRSQIPAPGRVGRGGPVSPRVDQHERGTHPPVAAGSEAETCQSPYTWRVCKSHACHVRGRLCREERRRGRAPHADLARLRRDRNGD
jgi:hypothetical protein